MSEEQITAMRCSYAQRFSLNKTGAGPSMRTRASIKGHSIHPMLVAFPITFFVATFISDIILYITDDGFFGQMAKYLEAGGLISGLAAAVPGLVDYTSSVPPESSAMKRATRHALSNSTVLVIFTVALLYRRGGGMNIYTLLGMEFAGIVLLTIAAGMGGTLVNRNQIGVDHRYAGAGKWKEERVTLSPQGIIELGELADLKANQMKLIMTSEKRVVIGRTESGEIVAFEDHCTHRGGSLADGAMMCGTVQCPWHGSQFDVKTGVVKAGPATEKIKTYPVEEDGKRYRLHI
jgi:nitrite reductase/ring-hydroxylating ferredoxin subunit/uncharacterized membrane protein